MKENSFIRSWIRQTARGKKQYYSVIDVIASVTDSKNPRDYWYRVKKRQAENGVDMSTICRQLRLQSPDGKYYLTDCADREGIGLILRHLPARVSGPLLRRKNYSLEDLQKYLQKKNTAEKRESSAASCRQKTETIGISNDLWMRLHRAVHPILKALYCTPEPDELCHGDKENGTQHSEPAESYNISNGKIQTGTHERTQ